MLAGSDEDGWVWSSSDGLHMQHGARYLVIERYKRYTIVGGSHHVVAIMPNLNGTTDVLFINSRNHQLVAYTDMYVRSIAVTDTYVFVCNQTTLDVRMLSDFTLVHTWPGRFSALVSLKNDAVAMLDNGLRVTTLFQKEGRWDSRIYSVHAETALPDRRGIFICYDSHAWCAEHKLRLSHALPSTTVTTLCNGINAHFVTDSDFLLTLWFRKKKLFTVQGHAVQLNEHGLAFVNPQNTVRVIPRMWWFRGNILVPLHMAGLPILLILNIKKLLYN